MITGELRMIENVTLPNGLRRMEFIQPGGTVDAAALRAEYGPQDDRYVYACAFRDDRGVSHFYMAWKLRRETVQGLGGAIREVWS